MDVVIRVMNEVKRREEEYNLVKDISVSIKGLPSSIQLARRERRLLAKGPLLRVGLGGGDPLTVAAQPGTQDRSFLDQTNGNLLSISDLNFPQRTPRLFDAINQWGVRRERSGSVKSYASSALSFKSYETTSTISSSDLMTPSSDNFSGIQYGVDSPSRTMAHEVLYSKHRSPPTSPGQQEPSEACEVYVFVFTDLVLLVTPLPSQHIRPGHDLHKWQVLDGIGMAKVLGVTSRVGGKCASLLHGTYSEKSKHSRS